MFVGKFRMGIEHFSEVVFSNTEESVPLLKVIEKIISPCFNYFFSA